MASRAKLNIFLTPRLGKFVDCELAAGRYASASEVVQDALRLLEQQKRQRQPLASVRRKIARGLAQLDQGESTDGEAVFRELLGPESRRARRRKTA